MGRITIDDVQRLFADQAAFCKGKSAIYVVIDMVQMKEVDSDARRAAVRGPHVDGKPMPVKAVAIVGGSFHLRLLGTMINKASAVLNHVPQNPIEFFDTFDEALQWIEKLKGAKASP